MQAMKAAAIGERGRLADLHAVVAAEDLTEAQKASWLRLYEIGVDVPFNPLELMGAEVVKPDPIPW
ncbi:hypothetical protein [Rhodovibrio sodomensis]|nr:hypothetical protein [Rhodovibrio sodomensis]